MRIDEETVASAMAARPDASDVGWFAARQPGIVGYLEAKCGAGGDAASTATTAAWRLCRAFHEVLGSAPGPIARADLERAQQEVVADAAVSAAGPGARQPELFRWLAAEITSPSCKLDTGDRARVGTALAAVIYALDAAVTGRAI